MLDNL